MKRFNIHQALLCTVLTFPQSKAVYHMGLSLLEFLPAILGTGEVLTICSKIKKIKDLISGGQHASSQYKRRNKTAQQPSVQQIATTPAAPARDAGDQVYKLCSRSVSER
jgi:hypothetical protein